MVCIYCGADTGVFNSRWQKRTNSVWRRRSCPDCQATYTTIERMDLGKSLLVKGPKGFKPFSRDKLLITLHNSLLHRKTALTDAIGLRDTAESLIVIAANDAQVLTSDIITTCTAMLEKFDKTAATHYRAFHPNSIEQG